MADDAPVPVKTRADLTKGRVWWRTLRFGSPLFLGMILHSLFNFVDIIIVGNLPDDGIVRHGEKAIVALTLASYWNMVFMVIVNGISVSSVAIISRYWGENRHAEGRGVAVQSMLLLVLISIASAILGLFSDPLIRVLGGEGDILVMGRQYLIIQMVGAFTMYFLLQITAVMRAAGESMWPMILLVGANLLNVFLDVILVYGWGPIPRMGVVGAAWGTILSRGLFMALGFVVLFVGIRRMKMALTWPGLDGRTMWRLVKIGMPNSAQITVRLLAYMVIMRLVIAEGAMAATAFSIAAGRLDMTAIFGAVGWGAAASAMVGQNLGAGKIRRAHQSGWTAAAYGAGIAGIMGLGFWFFSGPLIKFFFMFKEAAAPEVLLQGKTYLSILAPAYPFIAVGLVLAQALNGAGSTKTPLLFDAVAFLAIQIPLAVLLRYAPIVGGEPLGLRGVYFSMLATNVLLALVYMVWFRLGTWTKKKLA